MKYNYKKFHKRSFLERWLFVGTDSKAPVAYGAFRSAETVLGWWYG